MWDDNNNSSNQNSQDSNNQEYPQYNSLDSDKDNKKHNEADIGLDNGNQEGYIYEGFTKVTTSENEDYVPNFTLWSDEVNSKEADISQPDYSNDNMETQQEPNAVQTSYNSNYNSSLQSDNNNGLDYGNSTNNAAANHSYPYQYSNSYQNDTQNDFNNSSGGAIHNTPKKKKIPKLLKLAGGAALFGIIAGVAFQGVGHIAHQMGINNGKPGITQLEPTKETGRKIETTRVSSGIKTIMDVSDVVEGAMPSIVSITSTVTQTYQDFFGNQFNKDAEGSGSGIIIEKNDKELLIATNNHVIDSAKNIAVKFIDGSVVEAVVKGTDEASDLAVISIDVKDVEKDTLSEIKVAALGDSEQIKVGELSIAIGNAMGYGQSVTVGYVSAKNRTVQVENKKMILLQTDAAINPGNSGGALLNARGEVIGINSLKFSSSEVESMGYAIPISTAVPIINELMKREILKEEDKGFLGIGGADLEEGNLYNMPIGVYVNTITEDSPAAKAGILQGDIITKINDMKVTSFDGLREKVMSYRAGTEIELTIERRIDGSYKEKKIKVTLANRPMDETKEPAEVQPNEEEGTARNPYEIPYDGEQMPDIFDFFN